MRSEPLLVSKLNTALQIALIGIVLAGLGLGLDDFGLSTVLIYAVAVTTVVSGAGYLVRWARALAGTEPVS
jgi:cardiolipin synthase